jgi:hypothetical protein
MKIRVLTLAVSIWVASLGCALAQAAASPAASSVPDPHPEITARAKDWLHRLQTANIDRTQLDQTMNVLITNDRAQEVAGQLGPLGDPLSFTYLRTISSGNMTVYVYEATFKSRALDEEFALDPDGKIAGIHFVPHQ